MSTSIEDRLADLEARMADLEGGVVDAEMSFMRARIDDLRVQASLARMEAQDDVKAALDRLDGVWTETRQQLERIRTDSASASRSVTESVRNAVGDLRVAFDDATESLLRRVRD